MLAAEDMQAGHETAEALGDGGNDLREVAGALGGQPHLAFELTASDAGLIISAAFTCATHRPDGGVERMHGDPCLFSVLWRQAARREQGTPDSLSNAGGKEGTARRGDPA